MRYNKIDAHESSFCEKLTDSNKTKYTKEIIDDNGFEYTSLRPKHDSYYYQEETEKDLIVLHGTSGYLKGDLSTLCAKDSHVSVSYLIARNGTVYELFDPKYWSYHLGKGAIGGNSYNSKRSIGIELSNIGYLDEDGEKLLTCYGDVYCDKKDTDQYKQIESWRKKEYYSTLTDVQYESLSELLGYLSNRFNIPLKFIPDISQYEAFSSPSEAKEFQGICSHANFRKTEKWDFGPAFDFDWIESSVLPVPEERYSDIPIEETMSPVAPDEEVAVLDTKVVEKNNNESIFTSIIKLIISLFYKR